MPVYQLADAGKYGVGVNLKKGTSHDERYERGACRDSPVIFSAVFVFSSGRLHYELVYHSLGTGVGYHHYQTAVIGR